MAASPVGAAVPLIGLNNAFTPHGSAQGPSAPWQGPQPAAYSAKSLQKTLAAWHLETGPQSTKRSIEDVRRMLQGLPAALPLLGKKAPRLLLAGASARWLALGAVGHPPLPWTGKLVFESQGTKPIVDADVGTLLQTVAPFLARKMNVHVAATGALLIVKTHPAKTTLVLHGAVGAPATYPGTEPCEQLLFDLERRTWLPEGPVALNAAWIAAQAGNYGPPAALQGIGQDCAQDPGTLPPILAALQEIWAKQQVGLRPQTLLAPHEAACMAALCARLEHLAADSNSLGATLQTFVQHQLAPPCLQPFDSLLNRHVGMAATAWLHLAPWRQRGGKAAQSMEPLLCALSSFVQRHGSAKTDIARHRHQWLSRLAQAPGPSAAVRLLLSHAAGPKDFAVQAQPSPHTTLLQLSLPFWQTHIFVPSVQPLQLAKHLTDMSHAQLDLTALIHEGMDLRTCAAQLLLEPLVTLCAAPERIVAALLTEAHAARVMYPHAALRLWAAAACLNAGALNVPQEAPAELATFVAALGAHKEQTAWLQAHSALQTASCLTAPKEAAAWQRAASLANTAHRQEMFCQTLMQMMPLRAPSLKVAADTMAGMPEAVLLTVPLRALLQAYARTLRLNQGMAPKAVTSKIHRAFGIILKSHLRTPQAKEGLDTLDTPARVVAIADLAQAGQTEFAWGLLQNASHLLAHCDDATVIALCAAGPKVKDDTAMARAIFARVMRVESIALALMHNKEVWLALSEEPEQLTMMGSMLALSRAAPVDAWGLWCSAAMDAKNTDALQGFIDKAHDDHPFLPLAISVLCALPLTQETDQAGRLSAIQAWRRWRSQPLSEKTVHSKIMYDGLFVRIWSAVQNNSGGLSLDAADLSADELLDIITHLLANAPTRSQCVAAHTVLAQMASGLRGVDAVLLCFENMEANTASSLEPVVRKTLLYRGLGKLLNAQPTFSKRALQGAAHLIIAGNGPTPEEQRDTATAAARLAAACIATKQIDIAETLLNKTILTPLSMHYGADVLVADALFNLNEESVRRHIVAKTVMYKHVADTQRPLTLAEAVMRDFWAITVDSLAASHLQEAQDPDLDAAWQHNAMREATFLLAQRQFILPLHPNDHVMRLFTDVCRDDLRRDDVVNMLADMHEAMVAPQQPSRQPVQEGLLMMHRAQLMSRPPDDACRIAAEEVLANVGLTIKPTANDQDFDVIVCHGLRGMTWATSLTPFLLTGSYADSPIRYQQRLLGLAICGLAEPGAVARLTLMASAQEAKNQTHEMLPQILVLQDLMHHVDTHRVWTETSSLASLHLGLSLFVQRDEDPAFPCSEAIIQLLDVMHGLPNSHLAAWRTLISTMIRGEVSCGRDLCAALSRLSQRCIPHTSARSNVAQMQAHMDDEALDVFAVRLGQTCAKSFTGAMRMLPRVAHLLQMDDAPRHRMRRQLSDALIARLAEDTSRTALCDTLFNDALKPKPCLNRPDLIRWFYTAMARQQPLTAREVAVLYFLHHRQPCASDAAGLPRDVEPLLSQCALQEDRDEGHRRFVALSSAFPESATRSDLVTYGPKLWQWLSDDNDGSDTTLDDA
jgi:hypothetical protein